MTQPLLPGGRGRRGGGGGRGDGGLFNYSFVKQ